MHLALQFHMEPPSRLFIYAYCQTFERLWCVCKGKSSGLPSVSDAIVERVRACIQRSQQKPTRLASLAFQPSQTNVPKVLVSVYLQLYKNQLVQALQPEDVAVRHEFKGQNLARVDVLTKFHTTQYTLLQ
jgi:predicted GTPase